MTQFLPPNLLALFAPREPVTFIPPTTKAPHERPNNHQKLTGLADFFKQIEWEKLEDAPRKIIPETRAQKKERRRRDRDERAAYQLEQEIALWNPNENENCKENDPLKTLFVGRLSYDVSESKIRREFGYYGPIVSINMVKDKVGKPRGYCFIEFEHERDMRSAFKDADGMKIEGRRIVVDVERGRTVKGWLPRRLGGGLGGTRIGRPEVNVKRSGRDDASGRRRRSRSRSEDRYRRRRDRSRSHDRSSRRRRSRSRDRDRPTRYKREDDFKYRPKRERSPVNIKSEKGLAAYGEGIELDPRFPSVKKEKIEPTTNGNQPAYDGSYAEY